MSGSRHPRGANHGFWRSVLLQACALACVALVVRVLVVHLPYEARERVDRLAWDAIMREQVKTRLKASKQPWDRLVFIDVDEEACRTWQSETEPATTGCTASSRTSRVGLARIINSIRSKAADPRAKPALVVLDIDLSPVGEAGSDAGDAAICENVGELAASTPVIVVRPTVIDVARQHVYGHPSIFDKCPLRTQQGSEGKRPSDNIWFGSPIVWTDSDRVVRRVGTSQEIVVTDPATAAQSSLEIGSIGLLGGALLRRIEPGELRCIFPGSLYPHPEPDSPVSTACKPSSLPGVQVQELVDRKPVDRGPPGTRILFSVPNMQGDRNNRAYYGVDKILCRVPALEAEARLSPPPVPFSGDALCNRSDMLDNAVIMIGGSYLASGDLRSTPLNVDVPGAMIHLNAIRAFAEALDHKEEIWLPKTEETSLIDWRELSLIGLAALIGGLYHAFAAWTAHGKSEMGRAAIHLTVSLIGTVIQVAAILLLALHYGRAQFVAGSAVETLVPPLVVAFEGFSNVVHALHTLFEAVIEAALTLGRTLAAPAPSEPAPVSRVAVRIEVEDDRTS